MALAAVLWTLAALSLVRVRVELRRAPRPSRLRPGPLRLVVPWIVTGELAVAGVAMALPAVPPLITVGALAYTPVAVAAVWRMARLDGASPWMLASERRARLVFSALAVTWLGVVLILLLRIVEVVAAAAGR